MEVPTRLLRRSSLVSLAGSIGSSILMFAATAIVASALSDSAFDRYALEATILFAASAIGTLGYPTLLNRESAASRLDLANWRDAKLATALATVGVAGVFVAGYWPDIAEPAPAVFTIIGALAMSMTALGVAVARGVLAIAATNTGAIVRALTFALGAVALSFLRSPSETLAIAALSTATAAGAVATIAILSQRWIPSADGSGLSRRAARLTSLQMAPISTAIVLVRRIDVFLITALIQETGAVGTFFLASRVAEILSYIPAAINSFGSTDIASSASNPARLAASLRRQAKLTTAAVGPATVVLIGGGVVLFDLLGVTTPGAVVTLVVLVLTQLISALLGPVGLVHTMTGHETTASWASVAALVATLVVGFPLISAFGMVGAAASALITSLGWNIWLWVSAYRIFGVRTGTLGLISSK